MIYTIFENIDIYDNYENDREVFIFDNYSNTDINIIKSKIFHIEENDSNLLNLDILWYRISYRYKIFSLYYTSATSSYDIILME